MTERDQSDPLAAEWARASIADLIDESARQFVEDDDGFEVAISNPALAAGLFADRHTVTWERAVNTAGVAVRRYVARSMWQVDPAPPARPNDLYTLLAVPADDREMLP